MRPRSATRRASATDSSSPLCPSSGRQPSSTQRSGRCDHHTMNEADVPAALRTRLPRHAALLDSMADVVNREHRWRFLEVGCSLGAGGGDELSDIDAGLGYDGIDGPDL